MYGHWSYKSIAFSSTSRVMRKDSHIDRTTKRFHPFLFLAWKVSKRCFNLSLG